VVLGFSVLLTAVVAAAAMVLGRVLLAGPVDRPDLIAPSAVVVLAYATLDNLNWNLDSVLSAFRASGVLFAARAAQVLTFLVVAVALAAVDRTVWGLVWATVASFAVPLAIRVFVIPRYLAWGVGEDDRRAARAELPALLRFGLVLLPSQLAQGLAGQAGTWVVGAVGSVQSTGAYSRALGLSSKLSEAGYRVSEILMPGLVERREQEDDRAAAALLERSLRITALPLLVATAAAGGAAKGVLSVYGEGFDRASAVLAMLFAGYALSVLGTVQCLGHLAAGMPRVVGKVGLLRAGVILVLLWPLGALHGAGGVAAAFLIGQVVAFLVLDRYLARDLLGGGRSLMGARSLAAMITIFGVVYGVSWAVMRPSSSLLQTAASLAAGCLVAVPLILGLGLVRPDERAAILRRMHR
jgi:O-antigen/teichoic acid export membrane protein